MANLEPVSIFLVENNLPELRLIQRILAKAKLPVSLQFVEDGFTAAYYLSEIGQYGRKNYFSLPELILLADIIIPGMSGIELVTWIEQQPHLKDIPVVAMISSASPSEVSQLESMNVQHFAKPASINDWQKIIKRLVSLVSALRVERRIA
ncbi:response regulator [Scytonema sp. NUACC21]